MRFRVGYVVPLTLGTSIN